MKKFPQILGSPKWPQNEKGQTVIYSTLAVEWKRVRKGKYVFSKILVFLFITPNTFSRKSSIFLPSCLGFEKIAIGRFSSHHKNSYDSSIFQNYRVPGKESLASRFTKVGNGGVISQKQQCSTPSPLKNY